MSFSYEFDAPQFFDFANVANELNDSDDFFNNYVCKSTVKVKKKLKLGKEDTSKSLVSTPVKVNKSDGNCKKLNNESTSSKGPLDQPQLAPKIPRVLKSDKGFKSTVSKPFSFATESRILARRRFDESISKKRIKNEAKNDRIKELNADKEKQELVHKPIPVKGIRPFKKRPQLKKPTIPISPKLGLSRKLP